MTGPTRSRQALPAELSRVVSFDGAVSELQPRVRPERYRDLEALGALQPLVVSGGGYSYAAAHLGGGGTAVDLRAFNRVLSLDEATGVLECEGGVTLGRVFEVAAPRGFHLPVQPGYPSITVGGCIAADVHGKNQYRDGTFASLVREVRLFHPRLGHLVANREQNPELLELTCGGLGLTGLIVSARIALAHTPSGRVRIARTRVARFEDTLAALEEAAQRVSFLYTWHTFTARGQGFGRGFLYSGDFVPGADAPGPGSLPRFRRLTATTRGDFRTALLNRWTTRPFNAAYELAQGLLPGTTTVSLFELLFPVANKVLYFKLFGRKGFHEYQMILPATAFGAAAAALRRHFDRHHLPITLASCKLFRGSGRYLRFDGSGLCLALDFPRCQATASLPAFLDDLTRDLGGIPNVIKDSRLPREVVARCYPEYEAFRRALARLDPQRVLRSELSERLGL